MGSFQNSGPERRSGLASWWRNLTTNPNRLTKSPRRAKRSSTKHLTANAIETLEVRSMMAADTISSIWFQDVAGESFQRNGGGN